MLVIALYGHAGLSYARGEAKLIMADPQWPSKIGHDPVNPIMAWLNPGANVKSRSQLKQIQSSEFRWLNSFKMNNIWNTLKVLTVPFLVTFCTPTGYKNTL